MRVARQPDLFFSWVRLSAAVFFLFLLTARAATNSPSIPQYIAHSWDNDDGLPQNSVQAIVQTRDGYLWIGTQMGLARFDGVHFTIFDTNNVPELKGKSISTLVESRDGSLWIGTYDGALTRLKDGKF